MLYIGITFSIQRSLHNIHRVKDKNYKRRLKR